MTSDDSPFIAVIGMSGRFPGASTVEQFWANLCRGTESLTPLPDQSGADFTAAFGFLDGPGEFDADFFGYAPSDALIIDPQQRLFLECCHEALDRAGYGSPASRGPVGVFAGGATTEYRAAARTRLDHLPFVDEWQLRLATAPDFLATRVAHKLELTGPAVAVHTACSTSLVAVHLAIQALLAGDCEIALAGGATVHVDPQVSYTEGGIIAADGHCRAFDAEATGTVGGNAVAVVVLRLVAHAHADGDHIHAVVRGSAINNDGGRKIGFAAPSVDGQARVIRAAHVVADVDPDTITFVEAHGTGTSLGDPIEVGALTKAFRAAGTRRRGYCAVGSVKSNVGHTDAAAGVTGFIKAVLAVEHGVIPPSLHFSRPNPELNLAESPFVVNAEPVPWQPAGVPRRAGVSSLGVGGTNVHVVLEEPPPPEPADPGRAHHLVVVSAGTPRALDEAAHRLAVHLDDHPELDLADVAWTLQIGREAHRHRRFAVCADRTETIAALSGGTGAGPTGGTADRGDGPGPELVFMFPGQGGQHVDMAGELYRTEPVFREQVDECAAVVEPVLGLDLREVLYPPDGDSAAAERAADLLDTIAVGQPAVFTVEYALARLLESWGISPHAVTGHSLGAYAAACLAGVLSPPDAVRLVARRGQLLQSLPSGAMAAVRLAEARLAPMLPVDVSVAAVNGPRQCTVSGPLERVTAFADTLADRGIDARVLPIATAGHSALVDPIVDEFRRAVATASPRPAQIPFVSDTTGDWVDPTEVGTSGYWAAHLRAPVQFGRVLSTLYSGPPRVLVEVGPGRTLATLARQHPAGAPHLAVQTQPHPLEEIPDLAVLLGAIGHLWTVGVPLSWQRLYAGQRRRRVVLPTYPFARRTFLVQDGPAQDGTPAAPETPHPPAEEPQALREATPDETRRAIRDAFAQALGLADIDENSDLFHLGGDSLTATKLAAWAQRRFGVSLKAVDIIRARTVIACTRLIDQRRREETAEHVRG